MLYLGDKIYLAGFMTRSTISLRLREVVDVNILGVGSGNDLVPLDRLDVTQVVIVQDTNRSMQNI